ncbi:hypothetical protein HS088_TW04G00322 [Tripterygium wilfordii]|uniref:DUF1677 family protein n=1 Tax=Tripterygium wilfordii TaxID=458696 RepID=A0A7J7DQ21_TRIWF|nr:uncharacterized protein LOC119997457 isoform X2 [Tripterygium wilfordii]KAF5748369.1 hypothetical protein HS088_TW04G00322 [Tripterygium wilfordii]
MAATVLTEAKAIASMDSQPSLAIKRSSQAPELEFAKCECCGLTEECTPAYIAHIRERFDGRWICGLCSEAVKDEAYRSKRGISPDEALNRHMKFCQQFRSSSPPIHPTEDLISAMKHLVRRTLDSPKKKEGSIFQSPPPSLVRSRSCFSSLSKSVDVGNGKSNGNNSMSISGLYDISDH